MKKYAAILLLVCAGARAEFIDGNQLLTSCQAPQSDHLSFGDCIGYVTGVADAIYGIAYCPPANVTRGQVRDIVVRALVGRPDVRHFSADRIVTEALKTVWPCQQRNPGNYQPGRSL